MPVTRDFSINILTKNDKESGPHKVYAIGEVENKICFLVQTSPDMECRWIPTNRCEIIDEEQHIEIDKDLARNLQGIES